ncbi:hypothetical protein CBS101457_000561 [Exobasidium rhododendri]|nr:hypothetical protein CBS101457_000561 [Exobasidium rhododendri]
MVICTRPGCGVTFEPGTDSQRSSCTHHPGAPIFHEGSKSWSCCKDVNKPVLEFDEFLTIKGCTTDEEHTDVKKEKETFKKPAGMGEPTSSVAAINNKIPPSATSITAMPNAKIPSGKSAMEKSPAEVALVEEEDPIHAQDESSIASGSQCKRNGCKVAYTGGKRDRSQEKCSYHKGAAIFHEGSKGYTCCRRRVLEFDEFLAIEPCTTASKGHMFLGPAKMAKKATPLDSSSQVEEDEAQCRLDHYETPADVRVTVYAKGVEMDRSRIEIKEEEVIFSLALPALPATPNNLRRFNKVLLPFSAIDPTTSTYNVTRFKIDLVLVKKVKGESWPTLERGEKSYGYGLTFGRNKDA